MGKRIQKKLHHLYQRHGLFTFALAFIPVIPGFIEKHAHAYLTFAQGVTGAKPQVNKVIKTIFGSRGLSALDNFLHHTPEIFTQNIKQAFINDNQPETGLLLINHLFFDQRQRAYPYSDLTRSQVIKLIPAIFSHYHSHADQLIRTQIVQKLALLATLEKAIAPQVALTEICQQLINNHAAYLKLQAIKRQNQVLAQLESKMKGDLAGYATACDPNFVNLSERFNPKANPQLLHQDVIILVQTLKRLKKSPAPQVALHAHQAVYSLSLVAK